MAQKRIPDREINRMMVEKFQSTQPYVEKQVTNFIYFKIHRHANLMDILMSNIRLVVICLVIVRRSEKHYGPVSICLVFLMKFQLESLTFLLP